MQGKVAALLANALSLSRLALAPVLVYAVQQNGEVWSWVAAALFVWGAGSDVLDGRLARRTGHTSPWGRWIDHGSDIGFLLLSLGAYWHLGVLPWWVPASIALAFAGYVAAEIGPQTPSSRWPGRIGHWGGVANFTLLGLLVGEFSVGLRLLPDGAWPVLCACVPVYSLAAVVWRLSDWLFGHSRLIAARS